MLKRRVQHLVYTNTAGQGESGYRVVRWPQEWNQGQVKEVARWLATLQILPEVKVSASYAARSFNVAQSPFFCLARLQPDFSLDSSLREGSILLHAMCLEADPSDQGGMHLVALTKSAREIFDLGGISSLAPEQRLQSYLKKCDGLARVDIPTATIETFDDLGLATIKQFLLALSASDPHHLANFTEPSDYTLPQRLACATCAVPPRLRLSVGWGAWVRPAEGLNFVARIGRDPSPRVEWKKHLEGYFGWLQRTIEKKRRGELKRVLSDWTINDWDQLSAIGARPPTKQGRAADIRVPAKDTVSPQSHQLVDSPSVAASEPSDASAKSSPGRRGAEITPEFVNEQLAHFRDEINQAFEARFHRLELRIEKKIGEMLAGSHASVPMSATGGGPQEKDSVSKVSDPQVLPRPQEKYRTRNWRNSRESTKTDSSAMTPNTKIAGRRPLWVKLLRDLAIVVVVGVLLGIVSYLVTGPQVSSELEASPPMNSQPSQAQGLATDQADSTDWVKEWRDFIRSDANALAAVCRRIADAKGLNISQGQKTQFRRIALDLVENAILTPAEVDILRYGVFEYIMALYELESGQTRGIRIDLVLNDVPLALVLKVMVELGLSLEELGIAKLDQGALGDPMLQAAIVVSWIRSEYPSLHRSP